MAANCHNTPGLPGETLDDNHDCRPVDYVTPAMVEAALDEQEFIKIVATLNSVSRRRLLALARLQVSLEARGGLGAWAHSDQETLRLIAEHLAAHDAHNEACGWIVLGEGALQRRAAADEDARVVAARDRAERALHALCEHPPRTVQGAMAKAQHLRTWLLGVTWADPDIAALLEGVSRSVAPAGRAS